jgi:hypothetical protein
VDEPKSLYNNWEVPNDEGSELYIQVHQFVSEIMNRMVERGYKIRDVAGIMHSAVGVAEAETCLVRNTQQYKRENSLSAEDRERVADGLSPIGG